MRIAAAQVTSGRDLAANLAIIESQTSEAAAAGARLVVFPEAMMRAFGNRLIDIAEPVDGPWAQQIHDIAQAHHVTVIVGMFTPGPPGKVRNTLLVAGPGIAASYDKIHLFDAYGFEESATVDGGCELLVVEIEGVRVGVATCYDIRFPWQFTALARAGAQVIVVPASWGAGEGKAEAFQLLARARALDSTCYLVACDQADPAFSEDLAPAGEGHPADQGRSAGRAPTGVGHSVVVDPDGTVQVSAGAGPQLLLAELDLERLDQIRRQLPVLVNNRQPESDADFSFRR